MPNQYEPLTKEMIDYIQMKYKRLENKGHKNILYIAMTNRLIMNLQNGFSQKRIGSRSHHCFENKTFNTNIDTSSTVFTVDFTFL